MGARRDCIHLGASNRAVLQSIGEQLVALLSAGDVSFRHVFNKHSLVAVLPKPEVAPRQVQQVGYLLVVDLHQ